MTRAEEAVAASAAVRLAERPAGGGGEGKGREGRGGGGQRAGRAPSQPATQRREPAARPPLSRFGPRRFSRSFLPSFLPSFFPSFLPSFPAAPAMNFPGGPGQSPGQPPPPSSSREGASLAAPGGSSSSASSSAAASGPPPFGLSNSAAIRAEIGRFESVHPNIYAIYDLIERVDELALQNQIREHVISIEGTEAHGGRTERHGDPPPFDPPCSPPRDPHPHPGWEGPGGCPAPPRPGVSSRRGRAGRRGKDAERSGPLLCLRGWAGALWRAPAPGPEGAERPAWRLPASEPEREEGGPGRAPAPAGLLRLARGKAAGWLRLSAERGWGVSSCGAPSSAAWPGSGPSRGGVCFRPPPSASCPGSGPKRGGGGLLLRRPLLRLLAGIGPQPGWGWGGSACLGGEGGREGGGRKASGEAGDGHRRMGLWVAEEQRQGRMGAGGGTRSGLVVPGGGGGGGGSRQDPPPNSCSFGKPSAPSQAGEACRPVLQRGGSAGGEEALLLLGCSCCCSTPLPGLAGGILPASLLGAGPPKAKPDGPREEEQLRDPGERRTGKVPWLMGICSLLPTQGPLGRDL
ncbi:arf-GAP with GTPase ANK repeat and PH domain-containing protein 3-like [Crotalus adamanteus]|uniref:Arf-GAP with GTPase ANK repeat and PH domain-containing protein 3-like n=1 Tax=Crotalus adamanteus TaxID=8729 RepID=A0AAW1B1H8_CROAD